ncbi:4-amino-4-deoxy-L-arabinose-phosphoundecaprenol flippase subunit ArnE [mine drainage metagenome]|uniref:4-amino-4-deoxy-L-arabinose-phosphoundecaprenol flippase subunit ArnE n=1 Tax=mine drainage metagenome TaxID=410659 RepID=A0A1J5RTF0_9ZZZZ
MIPAMTASAPRLPLKVVLGLALTILLDTAVQLFWKDAVSALPSGPLAAQVLAALHQPLFLLVLALMLGLFLNWMLVLEHADLSYAHAITALSYASVSIASLVWLGERMDGLQAAGVVLILAGVWRISQGGHVSPAEPDHE